MCVCACVVGVCVPRWYRYYYVYRVLVSLKSLYTNWTRIVWNWSNWIYRLTAHLALHQPHLRGAVSVQRVRARVRMYVVYDVVVPWSFLLNTGAVRTRPAAPRRCPARHCALCPVSADRGWAAVRRWARSPICSQRCRPRSVGACRTARRACHLQRRVGGYSNTMFFFVEFTYYLILDGGEQFIVNGILPISLNTFFRESIWTHCDTPMIFSGWCCPVPCHKMHQ